MKFKLYDEDIKEKDLVIIPMGKTQMAIAKVITVCNKSFRLGIIVYDKNIFIDDEKLYDYMKKMKRSYIPSGFKYDKDLFSDIELLCCREFVLRSKEITFKIPDVDIHKKRIMEIESLIEQEEVLDII